MKNSILKLGKALEKQTQKTINGGNGGTPGQSGQPGSGVQNCTKRVATYDNEGNYLYSTYYSC